MSRIGVGCTDSIGVGSADSLFVGKPKCCLVEGVVGRDDIQQRKCCLGESLVDGRRAKTVQCCSSDWLHSTPILFITLYLNALTLSLAIGYLTSYK